MSPEKLVAPGDSVVCNMTRLGEDSWFIGSKISSSGVETNQKATATRLTSQPWAYNTVECYGCRGCSTYPDNDFTISECEVCSATCLCFLKGQKSLSCHHLRLPASTSEALRLPYFCRSHRSRAAALTLYGNRTQSLQKNCCATKRRPFSLVNLCASTSSEPNLHNR